MFNILKMILFSGLFLVFSGSMAQEDVFIITIATDLQNPRGVAVLPDGRLIVGEAGTGFVGEDESENTGRISVFEDLNGDGDFDDEGERTPIIEQLPGYNILYHFQPARDEIVGVGDVLALADGHLYYTLDDNFITLSIEAISPEFEHLGHFYTSDSTINAIAYDTTSERIYATLSSANAIAAISQDGEEQIIARFDKLPDQQDAVPSGIAIDPTTSDLLVTLFSGQLWDYYGDTLSFMPGASKVVRVNPETGDVEDEITGLTTAVDVAVDESGNIYYIEMTTEWPTPTLDTNFDLYSPDSPPDAGGYARFSGRVSMVAAAGTSEAIILADDLDMPTNITYHDGHLYISVGQGTPGRSVWVSGGVRHINGQILKLTLAPD